MHNEAARTQRGGLRSAPEESWGILPFAHPLHTENLLKTHQESVCSPIVRGLIYLVSWCTPCVVFFFGLAGGRRTPGGQPRPPREGRAGARGRPDGAGRLQHRRQGRSGGAEGRGPEAEGRLRSKVSRGMNTTVIDSNENNKTVTTTTTKRTHTIYFNARASVYAY